MNERVIEVLRELLNEAVCEPKQEYSPKEVAKAVGRDVGTVRDWCRMKRIKCRKAGRRVLIPHDELERLKATHSELAPPDPSKVPPSLRSKYPHNQSVAV
jgi:excisionase family DNA binding protein